MHCAGIDRDFDRLAPSPCRLGQGAAGRGAGPVIGAADQDEQRHAVAPALLQGGAAAARIERDGAGKGVIRGPARIAASTVEPPLDQPSSETAFVCTSGRLTRQACAASVSAMRSPPGRAAGDPALRPEAAGAEAVGKQHHEALRGQALAPIGVALGERAGPLEQAAAAAQRDDGGERSLAGGPRELPLQRDSVRTRNRDGSGLRPRGGRQESRKRRGADGPCTASNPDHPSSEDARATKVMRAEHGGRATRDDCFVRCSMRQRLRTAAMASRRCSPLWAFPP
ncbi:hypothetical protein MPEAHAMD_3565 [Methylobacterium frigidaeris]|uniref:Uncharacterized protein n=1 Tax=Methylobacterium frigidaeris TaxID=2038277 RepID=A0AA37M5F0_9HYPH|nr:hypothetical protein MPEAHAMD_3565 [Methylobacterium frigidaeris]